MSSNRRKQQQPRHIIQDPFLLTETLQNAVSFDYVTPEVERSCDNHTCGKCCAEFYTMPEFLLHKKHCTNEWPISFASDDSAEKVTVSSNTVHSYNATEIQMALASLQRQQIVQLQMIQQIYSQLLDDKTDVDDEGANGNHGDAVDVETEKSSPSKEPETKNDAMDLGCDKCRLCGKVEPNLEKMQNHLRVEHSRELNLPYVCDKCSLRFVSREELKDHVTDCHWKKMLENDDAIDVDETYDDDDDDAGARPKSYPAAVSRLLTIQFKQDSDDAKSDPGTYRCPGSSNCSPNGDSEMSPISSSGDSLYTGNNEDSLNENYPTPVRGNVNGESAPLDLSRTSATSATGTLPSSSLKTEHFSGETKDDRCVRDETPRSLFSPITPALRTRAPTMQTPIARQRIRSRSPANRPDSNGDGGASTNNKNNNNNEDDWESLMEIQNTDDTAKIRQMVGDKDTKLTDPNQCIVCHRILSCKSALQMHYRTHTGTRPFKCRVCQRAFTTKGNLKTHMGVHRTKPPFRLFHQCPVCHKRFTNGLVLQQHIRLHVGQPTEISMDQINAGELRDSESRSISPPNIQHQPQTTSSSSTRTTAVVVAGSSSSEIPHSNHPNLTSNGIPLSVPSVKFFSTFGGSTAFTPIDVVNNSANNNVFRNNDVDNRRKSADGGELSQSINSADRQHRRAFSFSPATNCPFPSTANVEPASPVGFQQMQSPLPMTASSNPYTAVMGPTPQQMAMMSGRPSTTCNICFKTFACYSALEIHYRSHTKERPFKCDVCNRGFSTKGNMKQHLLTHKIRDTPSSSITMTTTSAKNGTVWHGGHSIGNGCNGDRTPTSFTGNNANDDSGRESSQSQTSQHSQSIPTIKSEFAANAPALENASETTAAKSSFGVDAHHHHRRATATIYVPEPGEILSPDDDVELDGGSMVNSPSMTPGANGPTPLESIQKMWAKAETLATTSSSHDSTISPSAKRPVSGLNKHQCQLCYKNFSSASALQIHMRTHTGDRPFSCKVCGRAFTTKGNLKVHMGTHMWTNANRRGRRIFDAQGSTTTNSSKSVNNGDVDYSDDDSCSSNNVPSKDVARQTTNNETPVAKNCDNDADGVKTKNYGNPYSTGENNVTKSGVKFHHPHLPPSSFSVGNPNSVLLSQHAGFGFPHPDILSSNFLVGNPFASSTTTMASSFSPYSAAAAAAAQFGHHFSSPAQAPINGRPPSDGSLEAAMLLMWRTVCSVCHKVCASIDELEDHLKHHLGQVGLDRKTPLQT